MNKNLMAMWKEFNPNSEISMIDCFQDNDIFSKQKIIEYLNNGAVNLVSSHRGVDVITGQALDCSEKILTDGEYSWSNTLSHYVEKYNLKLPDDFVNKILSEDSKDTP